MKLTRYLLLVLVLTAGNVFAQDSTLRISAPIDISQEGWHKVITLKNGNTLLFHFEQRKHIRVKVFDRDAKEIASNTVALSMFNVNALDRSYFDGLYDIDGNAVLFMGQQRFSSHVLLRVIFNGRNGNLISENIITSPQSFSNSTSVGTISTNNGGYIAIHYDYKRDVSPLKYKIDFYDSTHQIRRNIYDTMNILGVDELMPLGVSISNDESLLVAIKTTKIISRNAEKDVVLHLFYYPPNWDSPLKRSIKLPQFENIIDINFLKNVFSNNLNILLHSENSKRTTLGYAYKEGITSSLQMLIIPEDFSSIKEVPINYKKAIEFIKTEKADSSFLIKLENPVAEKSNTNSIGVTTLICKEISVDFDQNKYPVVHIGRYLITKYNDNGDEMWATVLQNSHSLIYRGGFQIVLGNCTKLSLIEDIICIAERDEYILFNDIDSNFSATLKDKMIDVYQYDHTNAVFYHINKKKQVSKRYFFGKPTAGVYQHIYPGSHYYDKSTNTLSTFMRKVDGKKETLHIAIRKMDE